jgi:cytochrome c oxidase subunit 1
MPRRYWSYLPEFTALNQWSSIGSGFLAIGFVVVAMSLYKGLKSQKLAGDNPWEALTLEWQSPSPPPHENFKVTPEVTRWPYDYQATQY